MIRLTLLLLAGLFATLQIGGRDNGQTRFGLIEAEKEAALVASAKPAPVVKPQPQTSTVSDQTVQVAFTPTTRVVAPVVQPVAQPSLEPAGDVRYVSGRSVNVRGGPSTQDDVVGKLVRGDAVRVVFVEDNGWARVRVEGDGVDGYMSLDFLTDVAP